MAAVVVATAAAEADGAVVVAAVCTAELDIGNF